MPKEGLPCIEGPVRVSLSSFLHILSVGSMDFGNFFCTEILANPSCTKEGIKGALFIVFFGRRAGFRTLVVPVLAV